MAVHTDKIGADALDQRDAASEKAGLPKVEPSLAEVGMEFSRALRAKGSPGKGLPVDKEFIDSLYEDEVGDGNFALTDIETA